LHIGGDGLARGYVGQPALTAERFIPNPFAEGERLYKTGDRVTLDPDGWLRFLGRIDHQVKVRGYRVETGEIEVWLSRHSEVRQAMVVAREDSTGDPQLVAYVVPKTTHADLTSELRMFLGEALPRYMVPTAFVMLDAMPLNPAGKIDRGAVPAPNPVSATSFVGARNEIEQTIADVWRDVLQVDRVGVFDN
jgi:acyl-coenzyme A synthetase/AMP-(fatty) acid ligase